MSLTLNVPRISTHLGYFGTGADRYNPGGYKPPTSPKERIALAAGTKNLSGVELHYPMMFKEIGPEEMKQFLIEKNIACSIVSVSVWDDAVWGMGSLCHLDAGVRRRAVETIIDGMGVSKKLGANKINLWLGQDGFDYPFQVNYRSAIDWLIEGLKEVASVDMGVKVCLEYKPKEPRTHLAVSTVSKVLWLVEKVGLPNIGCLLDVGHAFLAYENPAESAVLLHREGRLFHLHFNDNYGEWDWDMLPGSVRFLENIELMFWLQEIGYDDWLSIDLNMPRADSVKACQQSVDHICRLWALAGKLSHDQIKQNFAVTEYPENLRMVMDRIFEAF